MMVTVEAVLLMGNAYLCTDTSRPLRSASLRGKAYIRVFVKFQRIFLELYNEVLDLSSSSMLKLPLAIRC